MKAIVLLSGGVDSTTCLGLAVERNGAENVIALNAFYGQRHKKELESSKNVADHYGVKRYSINLMSVMQYSDCSLLMWSDSEIPEEEYSEQIKKTGGDPVSTYVPFRNGVLLSVASAIGLSLGCSEVWYGAHADDAAGSAYPDCSVDFYEAMNNAVLEGTSGKIKVVAPFIEKTKAEVVKEGLRIGVPYEITWSCYKGGDKPCGKCGTCIDRKNAFEKNGVKDPIL